MGSAYKALGAYLRTRPEDRVALGFAEVEAILGRPLPAGARRHLS